MAGLARGCLLLCLVSYTFYKSFWPAAAGTPLLVFHMRREQKRQIKRKEEALRFQFKDSITLLSGMLLSGYSVENAMEKTASEMTEMWGEESPIVTEYRAMVFQMKLSKTAEEVWAEFGRRSGVEEIINFSGIFSVVKRSGGDLPGVIQLAVRQIQETHMAEEQIRTQLASRKLEQRIMSFMPMAILLYIDFSSPDFLQPMYETAVGRVIMTVCLAVYAGAFALGERISDIQV